MDARLLTLVGAIYEAASEPQRWSEVLQSLLADLRATHGALLFHNDRNSDLQYLALSGYSPDRLAAYREHYYSRDLWTLRGLQIGPGRAYVSEELVPERDFRRSEIYNDLYRFEGMEHSLGGQVVVEGAARAMIAFQRDGRRGEFSEEERSMLDLLLPHVARAVAISRLLLVQESRQAALNEILERLPVAVALLDARGKVLFFNDKLKRIADQRDGIAVVNGALTPVRQEDAAELRKSIHAFLSGAFAEASATMAVARKSGRRPYWLAVAPLRMERDFDGLPGTPRLLVMLRDPEAQQQGLAAAFGRTYGLSRAETRLLEALLEGLELADAAAKFGVGLPTVRTQLAQIFLKTDTRRQSELLSLVLRSAIPFG